MLCGLAVTASCAAELGDSDEIGSEVGSESDTDSGTPGSEAPGDTNQPTPDSSLSQSPDTEELLELTANASDLITEVGELLAEMVVPNGATYQIHPPAGCSADISILKGEVEFRNGCSLPSGLGIEGTVSLRLGGCGFGGITAEVALDLLDPQTVGIGATLDGQLKIRKKDGLVYVSTNHEMSATAAGHTVTQSGQGCYALSPIARQVAVSGSSSLTLPGGGVVTASLENLEGKLCESLPATGTATFSGHREAELSFERIAADRVEISGSLGGYGFAETIPVHAWGLCRGGSVPTPMGADLVSCGGCVATP
jgi:hypothetical protein